MLRFLIRALTPGALALMLILPATVGCSSGPEATDVSMVYARKQTDHQPAVVERVFNASHSQWIDKRGDMKATMLVPDGDAGYFLAKRPPDLVIPSSYASRMSIEPKNDDATGMDDPHVVYWEGEMSYDEYSELRGASTDRDWQKLIATIYRGNREVDATPEGLGYSPRDLPPGTFAAEDDVMRAVPKAFHELHFFQNGLAASDESRAHSWFLSQPQIRECLILTVDGQTTLLPLPSLRDCNNDEHLFKKRHDEYHKCLTAFAHIASQYRPADVRIGADGKDVFSDEQKRLREQADSDRDGLKERSERNRNGRVPGGGN